MTKPVGSTGGSNIPEPRKVGAKELSPENLQKVLDIFDKSGPKAATKWSEGREEYTYAVRDRKISEADKIIDFVLNELKELKSIKAAVDASQALEALLKKNPILGSVNLMQVKENQLKEREMISRHLSPLPLTELDKLNDAFAKQKNDEGRKCIELAKIYKKLEPMKGTSYTEDKGKIIFESIKELISLGHTDQAEMLAKDMLSDFWELAPDQNAKDNLANYGKIALDTLAREYAAAENMDKALDMVALAENGYDKALRYVHIAEGCVARGDIEAALEITTKVDSVTDADGNAVFGGFKDTAYASIALALVSRGNYPRAWEIAKLMKDPEQQSEALRSIALKVAEADRVEAVEIANTIPDDSVKASVLEQIERM